MNDPFDDSFLANTSTGSNAAVASAAREIIIDALSEAEDLYGPSRGNYRICWVAWSDSPLRDGAQLDFSPDPSLIILTLPRRCARPENAIQRDAYLAHETAHFLSPVPRAEITVLEEGMAEAFMWRYITTRHGAEIAAQIDRIIRADEKYGNARKLVERLLERSHDGIRMAREQTPVISEIDAEALRKCCPQYLCPLSLFDKFYS